MRAAFRAIDFIEVLQGELEFSSQSLSAGAQLARTERRELVKQRLDHGWVEDDHGHLEGQPWLPYQ